MNNKDMRSHVAAAYPGKAWQEKVKHMSDNQVLAIYTRLSSKKQVKAASQSKSQCFFCTVCKASFTSEDPDTSECPYCGSNKCIEKDDNAC